MSSRADVQVCMENVQEMRWGENLTLIEKYVRAVRDQNKLKRTPTFALTAKTERMNFI